MFQFEINDRNFQTEKLNAMAQFHVMRRVSPMLPAIVPVLLEFGQIDQDKPVTMADVAKLVAVSGPLTEGLASMTDKDAEFVLNCCLDKVKVESEGKYVPLWNITAKRSMFEELNDMSVLLPVVVRVIQENLKGFFPATPTSPSGADPTTA